MKTAASPMCRRHVRNGLRLLASTLLLLFPLLVPEPWARGQVSFGAQVIVWGDNSAGQLYVPPSATNVIALAAGDAHCLALRADGTVVAWGANGLGQTNVPSDLTNAVSVAAGSAHSLALRSDGTVAYWGHVLGTAMGSTLPPETTNVVGLGLGPGAQHVLALRSDGTVLDWGNNASGVNNIPSAAQHVVAVAAGSFHGLALRSDGNVVAWGDNSYGQTNVPTCQLTPRTSLPLRLVGTTVAVHG
jgi:alpha-tubulin suppressor-like RCC1 family protein